MRQMEAAGMDPSAMKGMAGGMGGGMGGMGGRATGQRYV